MGFLHHNIELEEGAISKNISQLSASWNVALCLSLDQDLGKTTLLGLTVTTPPQSPLHI